MHTVLHVIERLTLGGASRALIGLSKYSNRHGDFRHRVVSLLPAQPEAIALAEEDGIEVVRNSDLATVKGEILGADLVQIHWWNAPVLQRLLRGGLPPCRLMVWCHVVGDSSPNLITPSLIDHADLTIASNPYTHRESQVFRSLSAETRRTKTGMIIDPTDFDRVKNVRKIPHKGFNVGYIGTVGFYKMHADFVEISSSVVVPDVKFLVCGGGIENQLRMEAQRRGTASRFEFLGYREDIASVIEQMDVYGYPLCPDTYASGELNLQEVMHAGIPPVVFPYGGVRSLVVNQYTGLVVDSKEEYREAIEFLFHHPDERQRMGENAAEYARQMFGAEHAGKRLNEFYGRMLESEKRLRSSFIPSGTDDGQALVSDAVGGGRLFAESLGADNNSFMASLDGVELEATLAADEAIQYMSPVVHIVGILEYLNQYPQDGWLRYWSALISFGHDQLEQAFDGFVSAKELGLDHWRLSWFLALTAQRLNRLDVSEKALADVRAKCPSFVPAQRPTERPSTNNVITPFPAIENQMRGSAKPVNTLEKEPMPELEGELLVAQSLEAAEQAWDDENPDALDAYLDSLESARFGDPKNYFRLGRLLLNRGRFSKACDSLKLGLEKGEGTVRVFTQLAACSLELKRIDDFESYLDRAMRTDPTDPLPHKFLAHLNVGQGAFSDAANGCRDILKVTPDDVEALSLLAICFAEFGEIESELHTYDEILRIQPNDRVIQEKRAQCAARLAENQESSIVGDSVVPAVSAIVSTYNGEAFVGACLDDLLKQTMIDQMEIIVVDSGSEQSEGKIVADYQKAHSMIRYIRTDERETLYAAWNRGIQAARGRYVFNANTDDSRRSDAVEKFFSAMEESPDAALAYADCIWTSKPNDTFPCEQSIREVRYPDYHPALALFYCYTGCLQFWRRSDLLELGGFDANYRAAGDYEILMRLVQSQKHVVHVPESLSLFFQNTEGLTQQSSVSAQEESSARDAFRRALDVSVIYSIENGDGNGIAQAWTALGCFSRGVRIPWHDSNIGDDAFALSCFQKALLASPKAEGAARNLLVILQEHGRIEIGKQFLMSKEIGWTETQWNRFQAGSLEWINIEAPFAGSLASQRELKIHKESRSTRSQSDVSGGSIVRSIQWSAPFFNPSGYGSEALNFVAPLGDHASITIRHNSSIVSQTFVKGLLPEDRRRLEALVPSKRGVHGEISICHGPVSCFELMPDAAYHIGRTMFETDRIPVDWVRRCNLMDEIWVPTEFNRKTFIESGVESRKVVVIPGAVDEAHFDPEKHEVAVLPNRAGFNFLSVFEWIWRKGWDVLLKAYFTEFGPNDDVCLYLRTYECNCPDGEAKTVLTEKVLAYARDLGLSSDQLPRFEILSDQVAYQQLPSLYRAAQCLVAPSRGEGWGRPHHEAMMMGVPVIGTGWSGNTEFMNEENSYLLDYQLTSVQGVESAFKIYDGHEWAEPSSEHLRQLMRRAFQFPEEVARKGSLARKQMLECFGREAVTQAVRNRLEQLEAELAQPLQRIPVIQNSRIKTRQHIENVFKGRINWVGPFSDLGSLAQVNRFLTKGLSESVGKNLIRVEPDSFAVSGGSSSKAQRRALVRKEDSRAVLTIRHHWPPNFEKKPGSGALVLIQPWEFGSLPESWVHQSDQVDEFWVYSEYVRRVYVDSGVDPSKVKVLSLGVDPDVYSAKQTPFPLQTKKQFRFLFVGGTIRRKGPDALLSAYGNAFSDADDVTLVIKDFGGNGVYSGQTFESEIEAFRKRPGSPEIVYLNEELADDEVAGLYVACQCLVHPYRGEGFGLPVLEAMSSGIPAVISRGGACDDFTPDDCSYGIETSRSRLGREVGGMELIRDGWWLEPSIESLSKTMRHIADNPEEAKSKGALAESYVRESWTWDVAARRVMDLATNLLDRVQQGAPKRVSVRRRNQQEITLPTCARKGDLAGARALFSKNRLTASWDAICKEISERPFHPEAYLLLGEIACKAGDDSKANACSRMLTSLVPNWAPAKQFSRKLRKRKGRQRQREVLGAVPISDSEQRLSVCLIARNEEQFIGQCLESVKNIAYEMIVVDTGSDDATAKIAEEMGARVYHTPWADDFSKARNEALRYVTGDWVLVLDADEIIDPEAAASLVREVGDRKTIGYRLPLTNEGANEHGTEFVPRLFRNAPGLFYVGRIHEQIFSSLEVRRRQWGMENRLGESRIVHFGYTEEMTRNRDKVVRNLKLLKLAVEEMPDDTNLTMNLGLEFSRSGNEPESLQCYRKAFELLLDTPDADIVPELRESLLTQFTSALVRNQCFTEANDVFTRVGLTEGKLTASLLFIKGLAMMRTGAFSEAVESFRACTLKREESTCSSGYAEAYGPAPFHCEALCLQKLGRDDDARKAFERAVEDSNVSWLIVRDFAIYLSSTGLVLESLTLLHSKLSLFKDELSFWLLGARIGLDHTSSYEFALDWIGEGIKHVGEHSALMIEYVKALMLNDRSDLPPNWPAAIEPACESASSWAVRLIGGMLENRAVEGIVPVPERELSFEVIRLYRRLLTGNAKTVVMLIGDRLTLIEPIAPTAAKLMKDAVDEANALSV